MISKANFIKLFHKNISNDILNFSFSQVNEEQIFEFQLNTNNRENLFYTYDNRIYINCRYDLDLEILGTFESIDGELRELTFRYEDPKTFANDVESLLAWYSSNI